MKHIKLYESYISEKYITYDKMGNWGNASDIEDDLRMTVINMLRYGGISDQLDDAIYTDQSSDKGIKWEIEVKGKGTLRSCTPGPEMNEVCVTANAFSSSV